ncbi:MAG: helix-turn-helix transcriptional regulator [Solobacterium sp.]|nr:helix-turn-helix transcriptional regulator [Solobacterium sp.]
MISYNRYLTKLRTDKGLSLKEAAAASGVKRRSLYLYEQGYRMPPYKDMEKLSRFYGSDLAEYFFYEDISFPDPFDEPDPENPKKLRKQQEPLSKFLLVFGLVMVAMGILTGHFPKDMLETLYGKNYRSLHETIAKDGSFTTDLYESSEKKELYRRDENGGFTVLTADLVSGFHRTEFFNTQRDFEDYRFLNFSFGNKYSEDTIYVTGMSADGQYLQGEGTLRDDGHAEISYLTLNGEQAPELLPDMNRAAGIAAGRITSAVQEALDNDQITLTEILAEREMGASTESALSGLSLRLIYLGVILAGFMLSFYLAGRMKDIVLGDIYFVALKPRLREELGSDMHFGPFITDYNMIIISFLFILLASVQLFSGSLASLSLFRHMGFNAEQISEFGSECFYIGIFLMSYIQMDIFTSDKQIVRSMCFCLSTFLTIYVIEIITYSIFTLSGSSVLAAVMQSIPGNIFGVLALEYLCSLILFYTPEFAKKSRKHTYIWRSLSLIPLLLTIILYNFGNGGSRLIADNIRPYFQYFCPSLFMPFIFAQYLCMYVTYSLRVFFARKYGVRRAKFFVDGNKFQMLRNLAVVGIVFVISAIEYLLRNNQYAIMLGLGSNASIIATIPFLLLYHRHMGKRSPRFERFTRVVYYISVNSYVLSAMLKLILILIFL